MSSSSPWHRRRIVDRIVQEWLVSSHLVLDLADLLNDGFTSFDALFCDGRRDIVRLDRQFVSYMVEVVDDCGEDHGPSSDDCFEATGVCGLSGRGTRWNGSWLTRS